MKFIIALGIVLIFHNVHAQWPGYFYSFELQDPSGNFIDSLNRSNYKMKTIKSSNFSKVMLNIEICDDNKTWRLYEGYKDFDKINKLRIEKLINGEVAGIMDIEFPSSLTGGKEKFYSNLYVGTIKFQTVYIK